MKLVIMSAIIAFSTISFSQGLSPEMQDILERLDSNCAGNDNGFVGTYDVNTYSTENVLKGLADEEGNECKSIISASKSEAVKATKWALFSKKSMENDCVNETLTKKEQKKLAQLISDPTNRAVFSKEWDGESGDSEYCMYTNYDIYRADGTFINIVFNHTD